jgi:hypothetical protein
MMLDENAHESPPFVGKNIFGARAGDIKGEALG